jgi:formate dehydrogenase beta subunit
MKSFVDRKVGTQIAKMLLDSQHDHGYLKDTELVRIADQTGEPLNVIQDVVSFFPHYRRLPPPRCSVSICRDMSCRLRGAAAVRQAMDAWQSTVGEDAVEVHGASCLGRCDRGPAVIINENLFVARQPEEYVQAARALLDGQAVEADSDKITADIALENAKIDWYRQQKIAPNYSAVRKYLSDREPKKVIDALENAQLIGMGGAGAPTSNKWDEARRAVGETRYVVCNADESEPGTFKDRDLLLASPHLVIEGMIIAALVIDASQGFIYVRHEYFEQIERLRAAIREAVQMNACGSNIFGSGRSFKLEVFVSPGGYVCGEQTALIEALEGKRSEPRNRPPELQTNGLYDQPTVLNNVETFAWVPAILLSEPTAKQISDEEQKVVQQNSEGTESRLNPLGLWYRRSGRGGSSGLRFFSISGDLNRPGAYEVPSGILLGELIDEFAGGMKDGLKLQAVALSGPSGGFLPALLPPKSIRSPKISDSNSAPKYPQLVGDFVDVRNLPLDLNASREIGFMLGAGLVVYGETADMLDQAIACSRFYQRESCGKCVPCRLGSRKILDMAEALRQPSNPESRSSVEETTNSLVRIMETTSICGLGQVAGNPLRSYLRFIQAWKTT